MSEPHDAAWVAVAQDVVAGKYPRYGKNKIDECMRESLIIGLRSNMHPAAREALRMLGDWHVAPRGARGPKSTDTLNL